jgi:hypothetical protein|tara:strand:- start:241 stop:405 length:165 start_codon:yes stop_codon:yes gene_type:complete
VTQAAYGPHFDDAGRIPMTQAFGRLCTARQRVTKVSVSWLFFKKYRQRVDDNFR